MGAEAAAFTWPFCGDFDGDFTLEIIAPVACSLVFCGFEASFRALEMTKRRRIGAGFSPALRRLPLRCLRAPLPRAVLFLFSINNNKTCGGSFGSEKLTCLPLPHEPRQFWIQMCTHPLNFGRAPTPEDRRGFMLVPFSQNSRRNRHRDKLSTH
jgi:hypothetical protein